MEGQGEANGRSKQVEAVERGRVSVSAVHLVHSCSLRRAAGAPGVSGRRREIATDGRTNERIDGRGRRVGRGGCAASERGQEGEGSESERRELRNAARHFGPTDVNRIPGRDLR